jgi:hypothetical protein
MQTEVTNKPDHDIKKASDVKPRIDNDAITVNETASETGLPRYLQSLATAASPPSKSTVQRLCNDCEDELVESSAVVQPKLTLGSKNDSYEREADQVAEQVIRSAPHTVSSAYPSPVNHATGKPPHEAANRVLNKGHRSLQARPASGAPSKVDVPASVNTVVSSPGTGHPVQASIRQRVEPVLGSSLSQVRVHSGHSAQRAAADIHAKAFTHQNHIYLGANQSHDDVGLMAHELTHTVQQSADQTPEVQRFEATYHESVERTGLGGRGGLSQDEITQIYIGNWMRDVNQAFVPTMQQAIPNQVRFAVLKYMGVKKFGQSFSAEQLGFYIPAEHIDNPAGLLQPGSFTGDTLQTQPTVIEGRPVDPVPDSGLGGFATPQESVHPSASVSADIDANIFSVDQSGVMAFMRRSNQHVERRLMAAAQSGRNAQGMMHLGAALHSIEDLFAHSNWIEIAANRVLADNPSLISEHLSGNEREIFQFSGNIQAGPNANAYVNESRPILTTGSFVTLDTAVSISHELTGFLREGLHAEENPAVGEAQKELILTLLGQYGGENAAQYVAILQSFPFPAIPPEVLNHAYSIINPQLAGFAAQMEAEMAEQRVSDTNLMAAREANRGVMRGEFSSLSEQMMELEARFGAPPVADQRRLEQAEAAEREASFAATPEQIMAGPSHSQIAKDHGNSIFFGIAFRIATIAIAIMREKITQVWNATGETTPFTRERPAPAHANEAGWPWQEGYVVPWERGQGPTPRTSRNYSADLDNRVRENREQGENVFMHGHAEGQNYSIEGMRNQSADHVLGVSRTLLYVARFFRTTVLGRELRDLSESIKHASELIRNAETFEQRDAANQSLSAMQALLGEQYDAYMETGPSALDARAATLGSAMTILNREVAATAVAYTAEQRRILNNDESPLEVSNIDLGEPDVSAFESGSQQAAVRELVMQSRAILGHPYDDLWWYADVYSYIESNAEQFAEEVRARNAGYAGFRHDGHGH